MRRYCIDTSAYSHFRRDDSEVVGIIDSADWIGVPSVVLGELWVGFLRGALADRNASDLQRFLEYPVVEEVVIDREVARVYADMVIELRAAGTPIPTNDIWVAAATARAGATVLTYDAHFGMIKRVGARILKSH